MCPRVRVCPCLCPSVCACAPWRVGAGEEESSKGGLAWWEAGAQLRPQRGRQFRIHFLIQPPLEQASLDSVQGMEVGYGALHRLPAQPMYLAKERALSSVQTLGCAGLLQ